MGNIHRADERSRRQRQKQLQEMVNLSFEEWGRTCLHSSDVYRCIHGIQPRPVVFELVVIGTLGVMLLALQIYASKKFNCVVYEMRDVALVLVQVGA